MSEELLQSLQEGVAIISSDWRYVFIDDTTAALSGRSRAQLQGRRLTDCWPGLEASPLFALMQQCLAQGSSATAVERAADTNGGVCEISVRIDPCLEGLIVRVADASARREVAQRLASPRAQSPWAAELVADGTQPVCLLEDRRTSTVAVGDMLRQQAFHPELVVFEPNALLSLLASRLPRVAVIDLSHQRRDRLWVVSSLARRYPMLRIVVLAPGASDAVVSSMKLLGATRVITELGASGWGLRRALVELLAERTPHPAQPVRPPLQPTTESLSTLTPREREVLGHIANGADNLKVAALLGITERTVKTHVSNIFRKVGAENRVELALAARGLT